MTSHIAGYEQLCETAAARGFWVTLHTKDHALEYVAVRQPRAKHAIRVAPIRPNSPTGIERAARMLLGLLGTTA
jgi:hypothetical protein